MQTLESQSETDKAPPLPPPEITLAHVESETSHDRVEIPTAVDIVEEPVPAVQTAAAEVQATTVVQFHCKPTEEVAAIRIQKAFRGYLVCVALQFLFKSMYLIPFIYVFSAPLLPLSVECIYY